MQGALVTALLVAFANTGCGSPGGGGRSVDPEALAGGNERFAFELFRELAGGEPDGNLFMSPLSVSTAMGMVYAGARGGTEAEIAGVLGFPLPQEGVHEAFAELMLRLDGAWRDSVLDPRGDPLVLRVANALWVERTFELRRDFVDLAGELYGAAARNVDFAGDPDGVREEINAWVEEATSDRIRNLLAPGTVTGDTRLIITNAVYFLGGWMHPFEPSATTDGPFVTLSGEVAQVPMMRQVESFRHTTAGGTTAVELPYSDGSASMLVMMPASDLGDLEERLDPAMLDGIDASMQWGRVDLSLPSFEFSSSFSLKETLEALGMTESFGDAADFSGFTGSPEVFISDVIHKAFVRVDEEGTEAAAATAVIMAAGCAAPEDPVRIVIDRPFVFLIRDRVSGSILFLGRVADPS
jgi:serpin B